MAHEYSAVVPGVLHRLLWQVLLASPKDDDNAL